MQYTQHGEQTRAGAIEAHRSYGVLPRYPLLDDLDDGRGVHRDLCALEAIGVLDVGLVGVREEPE